MLTFVVVAAHAGTRVPAPVQGILSQPRPAEVPFKPSAHLRWVNEAGSVVVAGWKDTRGAGTSLGNGCSPLPRVLPRSGAAVPSGKGAQSPAPGPTTVGSDRRQVFAAADREIMLRYLSDAANRVFEVVDQRAILARVHRFEQVPEAERRQIYGALTAAIWLGGHELTYPGPDDD